jgi:hypothetical protein
LAGAKDGFRQLAFAAATNGDMHSDNIQDSNDKPSNPTSLI